MSDLWESIESMTLTPTRPPQQNPPYLPLGGADKIRLVVVSPGAWKSPISCYLLHAELGADPKYIALSYAWGSTRVTRPVLVDGIELQVTVNLESALRHLRREDEPLTIWIDAIAINQHDLDERSHQVGMMRRIYQQASRVIVWLGDGVRHRIIGLSHLRKAPTRVTFHGDERDDERVAAFLERRSVETDAAAKYTAHDLFCFIRMLTLQGRARYSLTRLPPSYLLGIAEALRTILQSEWWTRMWVFQEVIVASDVRVQYSGVEAPLRMFTSAASCLQDSSYVTGLPSDAITVLRHYSKMLSDVAHWRRVWGQQQSRGHRGSAAELIGLLRTTAMRKASDDRDRVFALLGLVDLQDRLVPDYQHSPARVFMSVCWASIQETGTLDVLCGDLGRKNRGDLPSWTVDWSAVVHDGGGARIKLLDKFQACGKEKAKAAASTQTLGDFIASSDFDACNSLRLPRLAWGLERLLGPEGKPDWIQSLFHHSQNMYEQMGKAGSFVLSSRFPDQELNTVYEDLGNGRLSGVGRLVGIVKKVKEPVYEPVGLKTIAQAMDWIALEQYPVGHGLRQKHHALHISTLESLVFGMKYVEGQFHRLQKEDREALSYWGKECTERAREEQPRMKEEDETLPTSDYDLGFDFVFKTLAVGRRLFATTAGGIGWGPTNVQPDDRISLFPGGRTPFVLRQETEERGIAVFRLVGDCYLGGVMKGEWALSKAPMIPLLRHTILTTVFWNHFKYDMVIYLNQLVEHALSDSGTTDEPNRKLTAESRPILPYVDKPGVFHAWYLELLEWANGSWLRAQASSSSRPRASPTGRPTPDVDLLAMEVKKIYSQNEETFKSLEEAPKPLWHVVIA